MMLTVVTRRALSILVTAPLADPNTAFFTAQQFIATADIITNGTGFFIVITDTAFQFQIQRQEIGIHVIEKWVNFSVPDRAHRPLVCAPYCS